jgi:hypothetical protein
MEWWSGGVVEWWSGGVDDDHEDDCLVDQLTVRGWASLDRARYRYRSRNRLILTAKRDRKRTRTITSTSTIGGRYAPTPRRRSADAFLLPRGAAVLSRPISVG